MSHYDSPIIRLTSGKIDTINDAVIGGIAAPSGLSRFAGQLGAGFWLDDSALLWNSATPGFGGHFRYVRLASGATAVVRGQIVFWDISVADSLYQVTTSEAGSTPGAQFRAGIVLNAAWTPGNYSVIQDVGPCYVKFRAALSQAATVGIAVYAAGAGAGADNGFADVIASGAPAAFSDVSAMQNMYLGAAIQLPVNGGLTQVNLNFLNLRG